MKKSDVIVYISGKYSDKDMLSTEKHVITAKEVAIKVAKLNVPFFSPHTHSKFMDFYAPEVSWDYWMDLDILVIEKFTNCIIMLDNYKDSKGALIEEAKAKELNQPVFYSFEDFANWYSQLED